MSRTAPRRSRRHPLAGLGRMSWVGLRTAWPALATALVLAAGLVTAIAVSIDELYPTVTERQIYAQTVAVSHANIAFNGRGYGLTTVGGITAYEIGFIGQLLFPVLGVVLAVRLTRREEEAGRWELLTAGRVGRLAPLGAAALLVTAAATAAAGLMVAGMAAVGLPAAGSAWYAAGAGTCIAFFGAVGILLGQLCQGARTASLAGLVVVLAAFLSRASADVLDSDAALASPLGWLPEVRSFGGPQAWPLLAYGGGAIVLLVVAAAVAHRRDIGAGVLAPRPGPPDARRGLATTLGLTWRLCRGAVFGCAALGAIWAVVTGLLGEEMSRLVEANPGILAAVGLTRGSDLMLLMATIITGATAAAVGVQAGTRLAAEEGSGRLGAVLSTRVRRARLWLVWWTTAVLASQLVLGLSSLTLGLSTMAVTGEREDLRTALEVGAGYAVPVAFVTALSAALAALGPRVPAVGWIVVAWIVTVGFLDEALRLPEWSRDLSPLHLVGRLPIDDVDQLATVGLGAAAVLLLGATVLRFSRRDLAAG